MNTTKNTPAVAAKPAQALAPQQPSMLATLAAQNGIGGPELDVLRTVICSKANDAEIALFLIICAKKRLDPFSGQMHMVIRHNKDERKPTFQTSIDGYRATASRTGEAAGIDEPKYTLDKDGLLIMASVVVFRFVNGQRCPFYGEARWSEFCPAAPNDSMWKKMPFHMLAKCAEAQAQRKAFPAELGGTHIDEEMHQVGGDVSGMPMKRATTARTMNAQLTASAPAEDVPQEPSVVAELANAREAFAKIGVTWDKVLSEAGISFTKSKDGPVFDPEFVGDENMAAMRAYYAKLTTKPEGG